MIWNVQDEYQHDETLKRSLYYSPAELVQFKAEARAERKRRSLIKVMRAFQLDNEQEAEQLLVVLTQKQRRIQRQRLQQQLTIEAR